MKANKNKLIPDLRFPEFKDNWANISIAEVCDVFRGGTFSKVDMVENGKFYCIHYGQLFTKYDDIIETVISKTNKSAVFKSKVGDILMPSSDVTPNGLAKASVILLDDVVLGGDMNILRPKIDINSIFLNYLINYNKTEIIKLVSGTTVKHIYPSQIVDLKLIISNSEKEQQKIASCLSSLDKIITAQTAKLELLQNHKKGLMQNLFPQDGEKVPKFRFPEFLEDGYWKEERFDEVFEFLVTNSFSRENLNYENGLVKNIHYGDIHTKFSTLFDITKEVVPFVNSDLPVERIRDECYCVEGDLIFADASEDLEDVGKSIEVVNLNKELLLSGLHTLLARQLEEKLVIGFAGHLFTSNDIRKKIKRESQGAKVLGISKTRIANILISFPKNKLEQQKIVDCLSSLDNLIASQVEKIEQFKFHKKGLMQGLFPKII